MKVNAPDQKMLAKVSMVILLVTVIANLVSYFQICNQLIKPVVPLSIVFELSKPHIIIALTCSITAVVCLLLYFFEKYLLIIIIAISTLIGQQYYAYW